MNLNLKLKISIIRKMKDKNDLMHQFQILIHKTTVDNSKGAPFKIRQYADAIKILGTYPKDSVEDTDDIENWFKSSGKKNPAKTIATTPSHCNNVKVPLKTITSAKQTKGRLKRLRVWNISGGKANCARDAINVSYIFMTPYSPSKAQR